MCNSTFGCPICMGADTVLLGSIDACQHIFCFSCIKEWLDKCSKCPICVQKVTVLHKHTLTEEAHALLVSDKGEQLGIGDAQFLQKFAPNSQSYKIEERQLPEEDPDPDNIRDVGHSDICEVCHINQDDDLCLLCDSCNGCYHTYCVNLMHVPSSAWFCPDCDVYGEWSANQLSTQQAPAAQAPAPANLLTHATRGSAVQLNNRLPRVRSRTAVTGSQPGRALLTSRRQHVPRRADVITVADDSDTASWDSDTPLASLPPSSRARAEATRNNADATSAQTSRRTEPSTVQGNTCSDELPRTHSCSEAAVQLPPQSQEGAAAPETPQLDVPQRRPRLRPAAQPVRPSVSTAHPSGMQTSAALSWDLTADDDSVREVAPGPAAHPPSQAQGAKASRSPHTETIESTGSNKRVREGAGGCSGFEAAAKSIRLHTAGCSARTCSADDASGSLPRDHASSQLPGPIRRPSSPCLRATGPNSRFHAVRLHSTVIARTCSSRRLSASVAHGAHPPSGTVRIRNTTTHQPGGESTEVCACKAGDGCDVSYAAAGERCENVAGPSIAENKKASRAQQKCSGASSVLADVEKIEKAMNDSDRLAKKGKTVADKLLSKCRTYMFVDAVHPTEAAAAIKQATACIVDGIVAEHPLSQEAAQKIARQAGGCVTELFNDERAEEKAHSYLSAEIFRFSAHLKSADVTMKD